MNNNRGFVFPATLMIVSLISVIGFALSFLNYYEIKSMVRLQNDVIARNASYSLSSMLSSDQSMDGFDGVFPRNHYGKKVKWSIKQISSEANSFDVFLFVGENPPTNYYYHYDLTQNQFLPKINL